MGEALVLAMKPVTLSQVPRDVRIEKGRESRIVATLLAAARRSGPLRVLSADRRVASARTQAVLSLSTAIKRDL